MRSTRSITLKNSLVFSARMILKAKRFILRPYRKGDEESLVKNINDKKVSRYMTPRVPYPYTKKDAMQWLGQCRAYARTKKGYPFAIIIDNKVIGSVSLENIDLHKAELGYWLGRKYWGQGIMTEAVKMVTHFGFHKLELKRIYARAVVHNKASQKVLEKNGFSYEGLLRKDFYRNGKTFHTKLYAKVR